jgi:hypothetical protein
MAVQSHLFQKLFVAQSALDTLSVVVDCINFERFRVYHIGTAGVTAGAIQIEHSPDPSFSGTWLVLATPDTVAANAVKSIAIGVSVLRYVRARISTAVTGGTVDLWLVAN